MKVLSWFYSGKTGGTSTTPLLGTALFRLQYIRATITIDREQKPILNKYYSAMPVYKINVISRFQASPTASARVR